MKTLILYATKHGATKEIAERLANQMKDAAICDMKGQIPPIGDFDCIVIGSSVYASKIRKEAAKFLAENIDVLYTKRVGIFLSGLLESQEYWQENFPPRLLADAKAAAFMGGIFNPKKTNFVERIAVKAVAKITTHTSTIGDKKIAEFANKLRDA
ncbi:MAG: flavodoxin domain-containing protein [Defluviitaleaceae bacterium]|nr:flavodoxin domain-containing protein [Defluviitaleaceae bacterium]